MPRNRENAMPCHQQLWTAALIALAITFGADAAAQGKSGNTVGAPSGATGGGATGGGATGGGAAGGGAASAANRGGAGGVSNPNPGGGPAMQGEPGLSSGPQGTGTSRSGYIGGSTTDPVNPVDPVDPVNPVNPPPPTTITSVTTAQFGKCPTPGGGALSPQARLSGSNIGRIETVSRYLIRGPQKRGGPADANYLLADLQEELQKANPDLTLAGTYLGIIAKTAVTPALATDVSESLCAPMSREAAELVAKVAETQRRKLAQ